MRHPFRTLIASSSSRALSALAAPACIAFASLVAACSDDPAEPPGGNADPDYTQLTDANNYTFASELHIDSVSVAAESDVTIKWDGIKNDIQCHAVDPAQDIDMIMFLRFKGTSKEEIAALLDTGAPSSADLRSPAPFKFEPDGSSTTIKLSDFSAPSQAFVPGDHLKEEPNVNLLIFQNGTSLGQGARAMVFVDPTTSSSSSTIDMKDHSNTDCSLLDWSVSLHDLTPVPVSKTGPWKLEWTKMKTNGQDLELARAQIDRMLIGFYAGKEVADLEEGFLDLEEDGVATESYELKLDAISKANLSAAKSRETGDTFSGFDKGPGTWIMGLFCDACSNPAPLVLTILQPE